MENLFLYFGVKINNLCEHIYRNIIIHTHIYFSLRVIYIYTFYPKYNIYIESPLNPKKTLQNSSFLGNVFYPILPNLPKTFEKLLIFLLFLIFHAFFSSFFYPKFSTFFNFFSFFFFRLISFLLTKNNTFPRR